MDQIYKTWVAINHRCHGKGTKDRIYQWYRDKGIVVCDEWRNSYPVFRDWALSHGFETGLTIDRIDSDGNYCPNNCRWVTRSENSKNKKPISSRSKSKKSKLPDMSMYRTLTEEELMTAAQLWEALQQLPEEKKNYVLGYAEALADIKTGKITVEVDNERNSGEQGGDKPTEQPDP